MTGQTLGAKVDVAVVGAGILGLAHALAAARLGKSVAVIDRDAQANGASIRNFGFVTVTGQQAGDTWRRAARSRDVWLEAAPQAGIAVEQSGLLLLMRRPESLAVAEAFLGTDMGAACQALDPAEVRRRWPGLPAPDLDGALFSPHERRVESRTAVPKLAAWLAAQYGVTFHWRTAALAVTDEGVATSRGLVEAETIILCPGDDLVTFYPDRIAAHQVQLCRLSMLRLASPGFAVGPCLMSDLGLARYQGYAELPEAEALKQRLGHEQPEALRHGVHLIVAQSADGSLVVGDSHHYDATPWPFAPIEAEALILEEFQAATGLVPPPVLERWTGVYASAPDRNVLIEAPEPHVRLVMVTSGNGASTAFAIAEEVIGEVFQTPMGNIR
jgi:FAD dependent oxidoreductase TIGR03364